MHWGHKGKKALIVYVLTPLSILGCFFIILTYYMFPLVISGLRFDSVLLLDVLIRHPPIPNLAHSFDGTNSASSATWRYPTSATRSASSGERSICETPRNVRGRRSPTCVKRARARTRAHA